MRKIIQISNAAVIGDEVQFGNNVSIIALCDDGTVWEYLWPVNNGSGEWQKLPEIPQGKIKEQAND